MYKINDYVVYETTGICKVVDICTRKIKDTEREYYVLSPVYSNTDLTIYTCIENAGSSIRKPIEKEDAIRLIKSMPNVEGIWSDDCRSRESEYKEIIKTGDCDKLIGMLKGLRTRKKSLDESGKKLAMMDKKNFDNAERLLHQEFAIALNIDLEEMNDYIESVINEN